MVLELVRVVGNIGPEVHGQLFRSDPTKGHPGVKLLVNAPSGCPMDTKFDRMKYGEVMAH